MSTIFITQKIHQKAEETLKAAGFEVVTSDKKGVLTKPELIAALSTAQAAGKPYDGIISLLTNKIDAEVFAAAPSIKIVSNYAVGFDNINLEDAKAHGITVANAPGISSQAVAEHTVALITSLAMRIVEGDDFIRAGKYTGWDPDIFWGTDIKGSTLGLLGAGHIGSMVAQAVKGLGMNVVYYDVRRNDEIEKTAGATYYPTPEDVLKVADFVSVHVPLLPTTQHLVNAERLALMKKSAFLINTSRGPVVDEVALVAALQNGTIRGAALDVYEHEPNLTPGLASLPNVVLTPHIGSATEQTRASMSADAAGNIVDFFAGRPLARKIV